MTAAGHAWIRDDESHEPVVVRRTLAELRAEHAILEELNRPTRDRLGLDSGEDPLEWVCRQNRERKARSDAERAAARERVQRRRERHRVLYWILGDCLWFR